MVYDQQYVEGYLERFVRSKRPELESCLLAVFHSLKSGAELAGIDFLGLVEAASDRSAVVYGIGTEFLGKLAEDNPNALEAIYSMSRSNYAHVRHNAVLCVTKKTPPAACAEIIRMALKDKSVRVRQKAADWAQRLLVTHVASDISSALHHETDSNTVAVMRAALQALGRKQLGALHA